MRFVLMGLSSRHGCERGHGHAGAGRGASGAITARRRFDLHEREHAVFSPRVSLSDRTANGELPQEHATRQKAAVEFEPSGFGARLITRRFSNTQPVRSIARRLLRVLVNGMTALAVSRCKQPHDLL